MHEVGDHGLHNCRQQRWLALLPLGQRGLLDLGGEARVDRRESSGRMKWFMWRARMFICLSGMVNDEDVNWAATKQACSRCPLLQGCRRFSSELTKCLGGGLSGYMDGGDVSLDTVTLAGARVLTIASPGQSPAACCAHLCAHTRAHGRMISLVNP